MTITLQHGPYGTYRLVAEDGRDLLIQSDWDFPGTAASFGWQACRCRATDGTVACRHKTVQQMMAEAVAFLDDHIGTTVEDPGYFG